MSAATTTHPAADHRHIWALVLGILSIPGSTVAWDLPAGGLWIGLPLGVAAIVLGVKVWGRAAAKVGVVLAALSVGQMIVYSVVSAAA